MATRRQCLDDMPPNDVQVGDEGAMQEFASGNVKGEKVAFTTINNTQYTATDGIDRQEPSQNRFTLLGNISLRATYNNCTPLLLCVPYFSATSK